MSNIGYIKATGDQDYNFAYSDFCIEFFVSASSSNNNCQTLFEITNNESAAANLYTKTRFLTVIENGNLNAYAIEITTPFIVGANISSFTCPASIPPNNKIFYNGHLLQPNQYSITDNIVTLSNITISNVNTLTEVGQILFENTGSNISANTMHFISAERYQNEFYLFLDGQSLNIPVPAFNAIPSQILANTIGTGNINRSDSPALLTIGANRDGEDPLYGKFGDIKIVNGTAVHVQQIAQQNIISGTIVNPNLASHSSFIQIDGGNFVDSISSYTSEELVPGQMFDTLWLHVYQASGNVSSNGNASLPVPVPDPPYDIPDGQSVAWAFPFLGITYDTSYGGNANIYTISIPIGAGGNVSKSASNFGEPLGAAIEWGNFQFLTPFDDSATIYNIYPVLVADYNYTGCDFAMQYGVNMEFSPSGAFGANALGMTGLTYPLVIGESFPSQEITGDISIGTDISLLTTANIGCVIYQSLNQSNIFPPDSIRATFVGYAVYYAIGNTYPQLNYSLFKPTIMAGPTGSYSFTMPSSNAEVPVPWTSLDAAAASVLVNGNAIAANAWNITDATFTTNASIGSNIQIISTGPTTYYSISNSSISILTANVYANSTTISVANTDPFITPIIGNISNPSNIALLNKRGQIFIDQECITYLYIDRIGNTLSGLLRGTSGTGVPNIHTVGTTVINAAYNSDIEYLSGVDPRPQIWYSVPVNGTSLANTDTTISEILVAQGGITPITGA